MTDEPPTLVDEWFASVKPKYPIVSMKDDRLEDFLGVGYFPFAAVIGPDGKLAYSGSAGNVSGPLEEALKRSEKGPLFPPVFSKVMKSLAEGDYTKSYDGLLKLVEKGKFDEKESRIAQSIRDYLEGLASVALSSARALAESGRIYEAVVTAEPFAESKPPFPATPDLAAFLRELAALPDYPKEIAGGKSLAEADALEREAEYLEAFKEFKGIAKRYDGTRVAEVALAKARELVESGRPGWQEHCDACKASKNRRACERHREDVSL